MNDDRRSNRPDDGPENVRPAWAIRLQAERERRDWNKHVMARKLLEAAGTNYPSVSSLVREIYWWEGGQHFPRDWQHAYAAAFGMPVEKLFVSAALAYISAAASPRPSPYGKGLAPGYVGGIRAALLRPDAAQPDGPLDAADLKRRAARAWDLRQRTDYSALADLLTSSLPAVSAAVADPAGEARHLEAISAYVHMHNAASSLLKRLHATELGAISADRAVQAARLADHDLLAGAAILRLSNVFLEARQFSEALDAAAGEADALLGRMHENRPLMATWGALLLTGAVAAAMLEERAQAWELIGQAKIAARAIHEEYAGLHAIFGPTNLAIHSVQVATTLGDPREALRRADYIDTDRLPAPLAERRSSFLLDVGRSHYAVGDHTSALGALLDADRVAPQEVQYNPLARELVGDLLSTAVGRDLRLRAFAGRLDNPA